MIDGKRYLLPITEGYHKKKQQSLNKTVTLAWCQLHVIPRPESSILFPSPQNWGVVYLSTISCLKSMQWKTITTFPFKLLWSLQIEISVIDFSEQETCHNSFSSHKDLWREVSKPTNIRLMHRVNSLSSGSTSHNGLHTIPC